MDVFRMGISLVSSDKWRERIAQADNVGIVQENWYKNQVPGWRKAIRCTVGIQLSSDDRGDLNGVPP